MSRFSVLQIPDGKGNANSTILIKPGDQLIDLGIIEVESE